MQENSRLKITPRSDFGAKVEVELPLSAFERTQLISCFREHHLLMFHLPDLSADAQLDLFETFGKAIPAFSDGKMEMYVSNVRNDGYLGSYELEWHIDGSFVPEPFRANCLYAIDVHPKTAATRFASAARGYERLSSGLKEKLRYLQIINTNEIETKLGERISTHGSDLAAAAHRLVATHPVSGIQYLAANKYQTDCVIGLDMKGSAALLAEIYETLYAPEHVYEHPWVNGDLLIWDNLLVQHARAAVQGVGNRTLRRFTSGGSNTEVQLPERQRAALAKRYSARVGPAARPR